MSLSEKAFCVGCFHLMSTKAKFIVFVEKSCFFWSSQRHQIQDEKYFKFSIYEFPQWQPCQEYAETFLTVSPFYSSSQYILTNTCQAPSWRLKIIRTWRPQSQSGREREYLDKYNVTYIMLISALEKIKEVGDPEFQSVLIGVTFMQTSEMVSLLLNLLNFVPRTYSHQK